MVQGWAAGVKRTTPGRHDWICSPEFSEETARSGHSVAADESQAFLDVIRGFLVYQQ